MLEVSTVGTHLAPCLTNTTRATEVRKNQPGRVDIPQKYVLRLDVEEHVSLTVNVLYTR